MWRSLKFYWRMHLTVVAAVAVTTAVLTGALLVGDSVRGSLRSLTLDRLGKIDYALLSERFFHQQLGQEAHPSSAAEAILLRGSASLNNVRASNVQINAVDSSFLSFFDATELEADLNKTGMFPPVIINESLKRELGAKPGDQILLSFSKPSEIHRETILGNRDVVDVVQRNRFTIAAIVSNEKIGRFSLIPNQHLPLNAFVPLNRFQRILRQQGEVNSLLFSGKQPPDLRPHMKLQDYGLKLTQYTGGIRLESDEVVLKPFVAQKAFDAADELKIEYYPVLTYLANQITHNGRVLPYSTVTAITPRDSFMDIKGQLVPPLGDGEILLNEWAGMDLQVQPDDDVEMTYYVLGDSNQLLTRSATFRVKAIIQQTGLAVDADLAPRYPGIQDADNMAEWSPPFPVDLSLIRPRDEQYWDQYRATPKAFVSESTGKKLWRSRFGTYTSIRILSQSKSIYGRELVSRLRPSEMNFNIRAVKEEGIQSAEGATDFGGLFIGFSLFLIVSALLLVGLLFRLNVDQRKKEIGVLLATGHKVRKIQYRFLAEGGLLALLGGLAGTALAELYAWLMITALEKWWIAAVGSAFLSLHIQKSSLFLGFAISFLITFFTIRHSVRLLSKWPAVSLLKGASTIFEDSKAKWSGLLALLFLVVAIACTASAFVQESPALFFAGGAALLIACLAFFSYWLRSRKSQLRPGAGWITTLKMAMRSGVHNPGRSLLSVSLVASACFVIVAVGASRRSLEKDPQRKGSGTGGFSLVASSDIPIYEDLKVSNAGIFGFRLLPGDDASCLNLYQPQRPRILGATQDFIKRGGFAFQQTIRDTSNPWLLLNENEKDVVPAIGDYNSVQWILHKKLDDEVTILNDSGKPIRLRIVALLKSSLLQSELLISEENFLNYFPGNGGFSYFLIETNLQNRKRVLETLESDLDVYGFDAVPSEEKLAAYHAVENTYLSTFQTLGALGLLLGTLGLGIILIRNVIERRAELATMRAFGYRRKTLGWFVLAENAFLLVVGIGAGCFSAGISILPHILAQSPEVPWQSLALTLLVVFAVGMTASVAAVLSALRIPLLPALKAEA
ncbi:ABC transporter permease [bacterium]|nr:ABC transporter permease [bacterium]